MKHLEVGIGDVVRPLRDHFTSPIKDRPTSHKELVKSLNKRLSYTVHSIVDSRPYVIDSTGAERVVYEEYFTKSKLKRKRING